MLPHNKSTPSLISPYPFLEREIVAGAFHDRFRMGKYGRGNQIKVLGVSDALAAISKTIDLAGKPNQLYGVENKY